MKTRNIIIAVAVYAVTSFPPMGGQRVVAQNVSITTTGAAPNASALLDVDASPDNNRGILMPRVTFAERTGANFNPLPAAAQGLLVYQTDAGGDGEGYYYNTSTTTTPAWTKLFSATTGWSLTGNAAIDSALNFIGTTDAKPFRIMTNNTQRVIVSSNGNVGIGTTVPEYSLHVNGDMKIGNALGPTTNMLRFGDDDYIRIGEWEEDDLLSFKAGKFNFSGGFVGIGTTTPGAELEVLGRLQVKGDMGALIRINTYTLPATSNSWLGFFEAGDIRGGFGYDYDSDAMAIFAGTSNYLPPSQGKVVVKRTTGNVGIGTTAPGAKLEVAGQVKITGGAPGANKVLTSDAGGLGSWSTLTSLGGVGGSGTLNYVPKWTPDGTTLGNSSIFDNGNVGIGTTAPGGKLHIVGTIVQDNAGSNTLAAKNSAGAIETWMWPRWSDNIMYTNFGASGWHIRNNSSATVMFMQNDGNVGIGTMGPGFALTLASGKQLAFKAEAADKIYLTDNAAPNVGSRLTIAADAGDFMRFQTRGGGFRFTKSTSTTDATPVDLVRIDNAGNVGIGTTGPVGKLHINGAGGTSGTTNSLFLVNSTSSYGGLTINALSVQNTFVECD